ADVQRRRLGHHRRGDRARGLPLARGPAAAPWGGGPGGGAVMAAVTFCIAVPQTERLDRFLADQLALSRTVAARLIADKRVTTAGRPLRASVQLERGALVSVELPPPDEPPPRSYAPAHRDLTFVYEDAHLAVLDKPAGLVVHPGPGHWDDTLVNVLVGRGTALSQGSAEGGAPGGGGRPGLGHPRPLRVALGTGRTHQIRVHLAHVGHPIVGDRDYAFGGSRRVTPSERRAAERLEARAPRQLLHAALLSFPHPVTQQQVVLRSEWPADLLPALAEAAADPSLLAQRNPLQYLGFFASDE